ncbi:hypothetical protein LCGC14_1766550 [marine sediment metagenome]|uniref:Uncharacterized protein n=1 Tax=marine sediment metagenome TaxID=412755 RepID=A0A0F9JZ72_9ZZZZ
MATDRLSLYKIALVACGERTIASLSEPREPRRLLDEVWNRGSGVVKYVLEQGLWNFAIRTSKLDSSSSISTSFGYTFTFEMPSDYVRLVELSSGEYFTQPMTRYEIEQASLYADVDPIYMRYISDNSSYGSDLSLWPETVSLWTGHWMGVQIAPALKNDLDMDRLERRTRRYLHDARSKDAQQDPTRWPPLSSWASARLNRIGHGGRRDRGSRGSLIG